MAMAASNWEPDQKELSHLEGLGSEQAAVLAIGYLDGISPWMIGERAGYSGGLIDDESKRRSNWAAAASRGAKKNGTVLPEIRGLQEQLERFRKDGGGTFSVSWQQKKERLAYWVMHGGANESIRSTVEHNKMEAEEKGRAAMGQVDLKQIYKRYAFQVGRDATREAFILLGMTGSLNFIDSELENEQRNRNGDSEGDTANDSPGPESGRVYGSRGDAEDALDQQRRAAGGADTSQRRTGIRDIERRVTKLEKRRDRLKKLELEARL